LGGTLKCFRAAYCSDGSHWETPFILLTLRAVFLKQNRLFVGNAIALQVHRLQVGAYTNCFFEIRFLSIDNAHIFFALVSKGLLGSGGGDVELQQLMPAVVTKIRPAT